MNLYLFPLFLLLGAAAASSAAQGLKPLTKEQLDATSVRVAAVQINGNWIWRGNDDAPQETVDQVVEYIARASQDGAELVVFPELLLGKFVVPNKSTERIAEAAASYDINVIAGCFEITKPDGSYGNSALVFNRQGEIAGRFFKAHPAVGEAPYAYPGKMDDPEWVMDPGTDFPVFDLDFGRIGILTCYDGYFPEPFRILSLKGAEILIWINARGGSIEEHVVKTAMMHNYVHMVCTNKAVGAGTMIAEWPRNIKAISTEAKEDYICDTLDLLRLRHARKHAREFYQRRPEIYTEILADYPVWDYYEELPPLPHDPPPPISLRPVVVEEPVQPDPVMREGQELSRLAIQMQAPWMEGWITLRFPEILRSPLGVHFIDDYLTDFPLRSPIDPWPEWKENTRSGEWRYAYTTPEGLSFSASARPYKDTVYLEFSVRNGTGKSLDYVEANACFSMHEAPEFRQKPVLRQIFTWIDGVFTSLENTTPTPEQKGRGPWVTLRCAESEQKFEGPSDSPTWWLLDQTADLNLLVSRTKDGEHLVGYAWDFAPSVLMINGGHPCFHTGPRAWLSIEPGQTVTRRGRVYFMENKPDELLQRVQADKHSWKNWPKQPVKESTEVTKRSPEANRTEVGD